VKGDHQASQAAPAPPDTMVNLDRKDRKEFKDQLVCPVPSDPKGLLEPPVILVFQVRAMKIHKPSAP